jgi:hypothetical protein
VLKPGAEKEVSVLKPCAEKEVSVLKPSAEKEVADRQPPAGGLVSGQNRVLVDWFPEKTPCRKGG